MKRRHLLLSLSACTTPLAGLSWVHAQTTPAEDDASTRFVQALRAGGVVLAARHALAPGNFDPANFTLGNCSTQRNLSDEGRAQARRLGEWLKARQLQPAQVRSSPWCRCEETARLAFGTVQTWPALGSPRGYTEAQNQAHQAELRQTLRRLAEQRAPFEAWVTHNFVFSRLMGSFVGNAEALVLRAGSGDQVEVLARLSVG